MPIPFDMIAAMLFLGFYCETPGTNPPAPPLSAGIVALCCLGAFSVFAVVNRSLLARLKASSGPKRRRLTSLADIAARSVLVVSYMAALTWSGLPWSLMSLFGLDFGEGAFWPQFFGLLPYLFLFVAVWLPLYGFHRESSPGRWTRAGYLVHKARYNLFMLLAWLPFALLADWFAGFLYVLPVLFALTAWAFPLVLAWAWGCRTLPEGEILDTIHRLEAAAGARFSKVYLWEPGGGGVQNAAAVGVFPPFRYLFLTPALLRAMPRRELEAVVLHELGHVKRKHLLFYMFTSLAGINLAATVGFLIPLIGPGERFVLTAVLVLAYFRLVFGYLSRNMERQADLFALEKSGAAGGLVSALEKLGLASGNIRAASSWHHMGIAERVDFLRRAEREPERLRAHNRKVGGIMAAGYSLAVAVMVFLGWTFHAQFGAHDFAGPRPEKADEAHWRRAMTLVPSHPTPHLELAYRLAGNPASRREAASLAERAWRLANGGEEKAAAAKLRKDLTGSEGGGAKMAPGARLQ